MNVIGNTQWEAVALAHGYLSILDGASLETAAKVAYDNGYLTRKLALEKLGNIRMHGFESQLQKREKTGSAENPVTKLFPAFITEQRFVEILDRLKGKRKDIQINDERNSGSFIDFIISEGDLRLPINVKVASTRFNNALKLVNLNPDDTLPIPAYKAYGAVEAEPNTVYAISMDFEIIKELNKNLQGWFDEDERTVWNILNRFAGAKVKKAEDAFVYGCVRKYWNQMKDISTNKPFYIISARKAIRILQKKPERTPGIGLRAWGTGANAEVNVHISISEDTKTWDEIEERIIGRGLKDIVTAINRKKTEVTYDPEI